MFTVADIFGTVMRGEEGSEKADVYSYGIVLWEIGTHETPFSEYEYTFVSQLEDRIVKGLRPTIPEDKDWPQAYADLVRSCWQENALERPSFFNIVRCLEKMKARQNKK